MLPEKHVETIHISCQITKYSSKYSHLCLKYTFAFSGSIADLFYAKTALECNPGAILLNIKCRICVQSKNNLMYIMAQMTKD